MPGMYAMISGQEEFNVIDKTKGLVELNELHGGKYAVVSISTFKEVVKILWISSYEDAFGENQKIIVTTPDEYSIRTEYIAAVFDTEEEALLFKECS